MGKALPPPLPSRQPASTAPTSNQHPQPKEGICAECGQYFPPDELIILNKASICARCKPLVLQRLAEGAATPWRGRTLAGAAETGYRFGNAVPGSLHQMQPTRQWFPAQAGDLLAQPGLLSVSPVQRTYLCDCGDDRAQKGGPAHRPVRSPPAAAQGRHPRLLAGVLGGLGITISAGVTGRGGLAVVGVAGLLFGVIWGMVKGRTINATKIEGKDVWVSGGCKEFLDELPER